MDDGAGGYDYFYSLDLSRAIETALQRINLVVYDGNSSTAALQETPLYSFEGGIQLEERVVPLGLDAGFECEAIVINSQQFTKTSNIWGVGNNRCGTNTNRIVVFRK